MSSERDYTAILDEVIAARAGQPSLSDRLSNVQTITVSNVPPTDPKINDIWIDTSA